MCVSCVYLLCLYNTWRYVPLMQCSCPVPLAEKHPQSIMFPPPCLTVGMVFLGSQAAFLLLQTRRVELMPKSWILVSSDHNTFTQFSSESLADFRRACTCAFLSRGTLWTLQDFSPSRRSVLPIVFLVTMVPAVLKHHWIIETDRGRLTVICVFLPFANNRTNCYHLLTKLLGDGLVAHSSLV